MDARDQKIREFDEKHAGVVLVLEEESDRLEAKLIFAIILFALVVSITILVS